jgi:hypothetical protein
MIMSPLFTILPLISIREFTAGWHMPIFFAMIHYRTKLQNIALWSRYIFDAQVDIDYALGSKNEILSLL